MTIRAGKESPVVVRSGKQRTSDFILPALFAVVVLFLYYLLYLFRGIDDSRLSSWHDVFTNGFPLKTAWSLIVALAVAFLLSVLKLPRKRPVLFLFSASFVISAFFWHEPEIIVDASRYFTQAKHLEMYGIGYFFREWGGAINAWTDLPVMPFLYGIMFSIFGEHRIVIALFNSILYSSAVVLTYLTGKELWNDEAGLYGGIFLLGIPYLYTQVPLMLVDVPAMFFFILAVYTAIRALRTGGMMIAAASLSIFCAVFVKYSAGLMLTVLLPILVVELLVNRQKERDRVALRGMIVCFASFFLISLAIAFLHDVIMQQVHLLLTFQGPGLRRWGESLLAIFFFQVHPVIAILAAAAVAIAIWKKDFTFIVAAWVVLLALLLPIRRIRYLIMTFPMLCLMASYGLTHVTRVMNTGFISLATAACSFALAYTAFLPFQQSTSAQNIRNAALYLNSFDVTSVEVMTPLPKDYVMNPATSVPLFDLFLRAPIRYRYRGTDYPLPEDLATSPLRFTWSYMNPRYYTGRLSSEKTAVAVITDGTEQEYDQELYERIKRFSQKKIFAVRDDVYQHQTLITVYH